MIESSSVCAETCTSRPVPSRTATPVGRLSPHARSTPMKCMRSPWHGAAGDPAFRTSVDVRAGAMAGNSVAGTAPARESGAMAQLEIRRFRPDDLADVRASLAIRNAAVTVDAPWQHLELEDRFIAQLRHGWDGEPSVHYLMCVHGEPVGTAALTMPQRDNRHLAWVDVRIRPDRRRRGFGRTLVEGMEEEARQAGRTSIGTDGWESAGSSAFATGLGLAPVSSAIDRRQVVGDLDRDRLRALFDEAAAAADGYELVRIKGRLPGDLVEAMVTLVSAINDAPTDDLDVEDEVFTPARLADYEEATLAKGDRLYRLVARHRRSGELAGHTVVTVRGGQPWIAHQHDTAVARGHRGRRLGLLLKAGMLLWLAEVEPGIQTVDTFNAESNRHMISVNEALGYRVMGREIEFQRSLRPGAR